MLTGSLKAHYDQTNKEYAGIFSRWLYSIILHYSFFDFTILKQYLSIIDLPPDTKLTNLSKLADLDMKKLPHPEESGDHCILCIQEFLINEMSSAECGVLLEDKLQ